MAALYQGDCLEVMRTLPENSVDTICTDPPYGLAFMGKDWDHGVPGKAFWAEALRVAKPGAMMLAFGGTRTHHRLMVAIEDAGWEIRDCLMWLYGSGFPKSHDISKAIDKAKGAEREVVGVREDFAKRANKQRKGVSWADNSVKDGSFSNPEQIGHITAPATDLAAQWEGYGTALKPAWEPIILAMKPIPTTFADNVETWGVAGLWIDGARVPTNGETPKGSGRFDNWRELEGRADRQPWNGGNTTPDKGRWPANLILDEAAAAALDEMSGERPTGSRNGKGSESSFFGTGGSGPDRRWSGDTGGASRFFYCAKASRRERTCDGEVENGHPTVKPLALCQYLARLTRTPTGGVVLDPFMGSGSIGIGAVLEGRDFIGIELDESYFTIARRRIEHVEQEARQLELIA